MSQGKQPPLRTGSNTKPNIITVENDLLRKPMSAGVDKIVPEPHLRANPDPSNPLGHWAL
jgi:hypothetical protein